LPPVKKLRARLLRSVASWVKNLTGGLLVPAQTADSVGIIAAGSFRESGARFEVTW